MRERKGKERERVREGGEGREREWREGGKEKEDEGERESEEKIVIHQLRVYFHKGCGLVLCFRSYPVK